MSHVADLKRQEMLCLHILADHFAAWLDHLDRKANAEREINDAIARNVRRNQEADLAAAMRGWHIGRY